MLQVTHLQCCGWREIGMLYYYAGLNRALKDLIESDTIQERHGVRCGALLFTQAGLRNKYGVTFAKDIEEQKLGTVTQVPHFKNPNTRRCIRAYVWTPDSKAVVAYCKEHKLF